MSPPRRSRRTLSGQEAWLWGEVAKLITPLRAQVPIGKAVPIKPAAKQPVREPVKEPIRQPPRKPQTRASAHPAAAPAAPSPIATALVPEPARGRPLKLGDLGADPGRPEAKPAALVVRAPPAPGLERKERRALERGNLPIEARIDLHGLYQAEAHAALVGFISRARVAGHARVLIVTGKGGEDRAFGSERGVLRRSVPHWLRGPELRSMVLGFEEAGRRHGGAGALYVRLRRR